MSVPARPAAAAEPTPVAPEAGGELSRPDEAAALVTARMTGKRVLITGLTTETDEAWAHPNGTVSVEQRFRPVRVRRDGGWAPVDTTLVVRADGVVAPKAAVVDVAFSGGGAAPMVTLRQGRSTLALGSPTGELPAPSLEGDTAVYAEVLPGVDLRLRADVDGFAQVLVVKTPEAARNPKLAKLTFGVSGKGAMTRADKAGNLSVVDTTGEVMFVGSTPAMWDEDFAGDHRDTSRALDPRGDGRFATMPVESTAGSLSITPNAGLLTAADTAFPVYIDPGYTLPRRNWTYTNSAAPTTSYWNSSSQARIGTPNAGATKYRSYFVMNASNVPWQGKHLLSARLDLDLNYSASCTPTTFGAYALASAPTSSTTWNNQPAMTTQLDSATTNLGRAGCAAAGVVSLNVTEHARQAQASAAANINIGLRAASETDTASYKEFNNNPSMWVVYTGYPTVASRSTTPSTACVTGAGRPFVNTTTPQLHAVISDDENQVRAEFEWLTLSGTQVGVASPAPAASGSTISATVWAGQLSDGGSYAWRVRGYDSIVWGSWSGLCEFTVDTVVPSAGPTVTSTAYPSGANVWSGQAGTAGSFTFGANGVGDVSAFVYGLDSNPPTTVVNAASLGGGATVSLTPASDGPHTLYVRSRDRAGNLSPVTEYSFNVGAGALISPKPGALSAGRTILEGVGQSTATGVTYQWRRGDTDTWATIATADVTLAAGGTPVASWPLATTGAGQFPKLNWNAEATVNAAEAGPDPLDGPLQVQAVFTGTGATATSAVTFTLNRNSGTAAATSVGPGSVNLLTGNLTIAETDVSVDSFGSDLTLSRTYNTRQASVVDPMFGPGWVSSAAVEESGAPYTGLTVTGSLVQAGLPDGDSVGFTRKATTTAGATFTPEPGAEDLTLTYTTSGDSYTLTDISGTVVAFTRPTGTPTGRYVPTSVTIPGTGQTTLSWETVTVNGATVTRPTR
ncbi:MAG TPA: DUF6531 domain-containing protein, partial [Pilimelia sp.]|nr:DUF6531 domain-containing protein [Pilimelia sp.]